MTLFQFVLCKIETDPRALRFLAGSLKKRSFNRDSRCSASAHIPPANCVCDLEQNRTNKEILMWMARGGTRRMTSIAEHFNYVSHAAVSQKLVASSFAITRRFCAITHSVPFRILAPCHRSRTERQHREDFPLNKTHECDVSERSWKSRHCRELIESGER